MARPNNTRLRSRHYKFYASVSGNIDLLADGPSGAANDGGRCCAEIHVFTTGNLVVVREDGTSITISSVPAGYQLPITAKQITQSGTTATNILVLW